MKTIKELEQKGSGIIGNFSIIDTKELKKSAISDVKEWRKEREDCIKYLNKHNENNVLEKIKINQIGLLSFLIGVWMEKFCLTEEDVK